MVTTYKVKRVEKKTSVRRFALDLSEDEAGALLDVLHRVGGSPVKSARRHMSAISGALYRAGADRGSHPVSSEINGEPNTGSLYFLSEESEEDQA